MAQDGTEASREYEAFHGVAARAPETAAAASRCPWPEGKTPRLWADVDWPTWMPARVLATLFEFYQHHGGLAGYERMVTAACNGAAPFGSLVVIAARGASRPRIEGLYVHAWNSMARVIDATGRVHVCSAADISEAAHATRAEHEASAPERRARLIARITAMDPSDLVRFEEKNP